MIQIIEPIVLAADHELLQRVRADIKHREESRRVDDGSAYWVSAWLMETKPELFYVVIQRQDERGNWLTFRGDWKPSSQEPVAFREVHGMNIVYPEGYTPVG